ncbi:MAG: trypsin-like peptidase domain-containing protein [Candidatus Niyogibacteria bacterium]|nr:trypsin-like peptidase domain-containing protein [Candidatus Niyogibacteria bacterium]
MRYLLTILLICVLQFVDCAHAPKSSVANAPNTDEQLVSTIAEAKKAVVFIGITNIKSQERGHGSGFLITTDGYILTAWHVVNHADSTIQACLYENAVERYGDLERENCQPASLIGFDPQRDVALLKIQGTDFPVIQLGEDPPVGQKIIALGHPNRSLWTATEGIVSKNPTFFFGDNYNDPYFLQTDAPIYFGSSGGPLISRQGQVVGIVDMMTLSTNGEITGINLAVPIGDLKILLPRLMEGGKVTRANLGMHYAFLHDLNFQTMSNDFKAYKLPEKVPGTLALFIIPGGVAEKNGLTKGDIILKVNDQMMSNIVDVTRLISFQKPGTEVVLEIMRQGETKFVTVRLNEKPEPKPEKAPKSSPKK